MVIIQFLDEMGKMGTQAVKLTPYIVLLLYQCNRFLSFVCFDEHLCE